MSSFKVNRPGWDLPITTAPLDDCVRFPSAVLEDEWAANTLTTRERAMLWFMDKVTDKPNWHVKVRDEAIVSKWRAELRGFVDEGSYPLHRGFSDAMWAFCVAELRDKAELFETNGGITSVLDGAGSAFKTDAIPDELRAELVAAVRPLEDVPENERDWHPGSDDKVLDLVHPSLWPLVYGKTRLLTDRTIGLDDCLDAFGSGTTIPQPPASSTPSNRLTLDKFQWLPAEVDLTPTGPRFASYINNLHPQHHRDLYGVLEKVLGHALPLLHATHDRVMSWQKRSGPWERSRIVCDRGIHDCTVPDICNDGDDFGECSVDSRPHGWRGSWRNEAAGDDDDEDEGDDGDEDDDEDEGEDEGEGDDEDDGADNGPDTAESDGENKASTDNWNEEEQESRDKPSDATMESVHNEADLNAELIGAGDQTKDGDDDDEDNDNGGTDAGNAGDDHDPVDDDDDDDDDEGYSSGNTEDGEEWFMETHPITQPEPIEYKFLGYNDYKATSAASFDTARLQVIVKLANIHLTPDKPSYDGGSWHIEGQLNEHICATALYYYDNDNITESRLAFQTPSDAEGMQLGGYEYHQHQHEPFFQHYDYTTDDSKVILLGDVLTRQGRLLVFPNVYQHRVMPFELADKSKPGHRKIVAFFLVDPAVPILSTANVPPQQQHWGQIGYEKLLPVELSKMVRDELQCPYSTAEARKLREELIEERKDLDVKTGKTIHASWWNFCEH